MTRDVITVSSLRERITVLIDGRDVIRYDYVHDVVRQSSPVVYLGSRRIDACNQRFGVAADMFIDTFSSMRIDAW